MQNGKYAEVINFDVENDLRENGKTLPAGCYLYDGTVVAPDGSKESVRKIGKICLFDI